MATASSWPGSVSMMILFFMSLTLALPFDWHGYGKAL
jgi:hypothetical protein